MTDGELVRLVVAGDAVTYGVLARRWYYRILAFCQARLIRGSVHDAEDVTQEVLVRGFQKLGSLADPECFGAWVRGIANHACVDWGRSRRDNGRRIEAVGFHVKSVSVATVEIAEANDERLAVLAEIAELNEDLREAILLHYYDNLTYDEMANWLGVSRATVSERLARARGLLRVRLARLRSDV